jgi:Ni,Fe-hydrogenase III small subunit
VGSVVHLTVAAGTGGSPGGPIPIGDLLVGGGVGAPGNITANSTHIFTFPVTAAVNLQEKFDVKAVIVGQNQPNLWKARVVTGTAPNFTEITEITIPAANPPLGVTQPVQVEVTVPNGTNGTTATVTLEVTSQQNASITDTSSPVQFTVGGAAPQPETIAIAFQGVTNGTVQAGNQVTVATAPGKSRITYQATVPSTGAYDVTFDATPAGFTPTVVGGTSQNATTTQLTFRVDVSKTGSPTPGTLKIRVKDPANATTVFGTNDQKLA